VSTKGLRRSASWLLAFALSPGAGAVAAPAATPPAADPRSTVVHVLEPASATLENPEALARGLGLEGTTQLSAEALAFYLAGLEATEAGDRDRAASHLAWAAALDASFPEPSLALARQSLPLDPMGAARHLWSAARAAVGSFSSQHLTGVNVILGAGLLAFLGGLLVVVYVAMTALPRAHHSVAELLRRWIPARIAPWLAVLLMTAPIGWRVGLLPLACLLAGFLLPWARPSERRWVASWTALIVLAPIAVWALSPLLFSPMDPGGRPFLLQRAMASPHSPGLEAALAEAVSGDPEDGNLWFALGLTQARGERGRAAWDSYQKSLALGGPGWQTRNNLGVIAFRAGRVDDAMALLEEASELAPGAAAPHFNLSQVYARKLYFEKADLALAEANRLEFGRIRTALRNQKAGDVQALIAETLPTAALWEAAWRSPRVMPGVPARLGLLVPGSSWLLGPVSLVLFGFGLFVAGRLHRSLPTRGCVNCGRPICRRCHRRIRRDAYCASCGDLLLSAENVAYSRLILDSRLRRYRSLGTVLNQAATWGLPGFHAARRERLFVAGVLAGVTMWGVFALWHPGPIVNRLAWLPGIPDPWWPFVPTLLLGFGFGLSVLSVFRIKAAPVAPALPGRIHGEDDAEDALASESDERTAA
jgi:tetratricopeptide (TPR) repeat protein